MFLQKRPNSHWGKTSCLKNDITPEICCRKHTASALPKYKNTTQCQRLHSKLGGDENQKQNVKTYFQKKGRPVLNTVQKILAHSSIFLSMKTRPHSDKQQGNTASLKKMSLSFFSFLKSYSKNKSKKTSLWKLLQTSFCAVYAAITKCTPLKPTQSRETPARKNALKIKTKSPKDGSKSGEK